MDATRQFVIESFGIEGYNPSQYDLERQMALTKDFLALPDLRIPDLNNAVNTIAPGNELRKRHGLNVRIGLHHPPIGGPKVQVELNVILDKANNKVNPWLVHYEFETLHPYTDGNGRLGRLIWLWQMVNQVGFRPETRAFLHEFYYQTLQGLRDWLQPSELM